MYWDIDYLEQCFWLGYSQKKIKKELSSSFNLIFVGQIKTVA